MPFENKIIIKFIAKATHLSFMFIQTNNYRQITSYNTTFKTKIVRTLFYLVW